MDGPADGQPKCMDSLGAWMALRMDSPSAVRTEALGGVRVLAGQARPTQIMPSWLHLCKHYLILFKRFIIHAAIRLLV